MTKTSRNLAIAFGAVLALCGAGSLASCGADDSPAPVSTPVVTAVPTTTRPTLDAESKQKDLEEQEEAARALTEAQESAEAVIAEPEGVTEGLYLVGDDIKAGVYKTTGAEEGSYLCYAHSAKSDSDDAIINQIVTNKEKAPQRITLRKGQYFKTSGCAPWMKQ